MNDKDKIKRVLICESGIPLEMLKRIRENVEIVKIVEENKFLDNELLCDIKIENVDRSLTEIIRDGKFYKEPLKNKIFCETKFCDKYVMKKRRMK